ncbi:MAG: membrane protein insertase YidC [Nitrospirae bacterium]|nr:membrane protein insertase YidC [Nitrospirota bacterium]
MEKRALIAVVLSVAILIIWQWMFPAPQPAPEAVKSVHQSAQPDTAASSAASAPAAAPTPAASLNTAAATPEAQAREIAIETPLYRAVFSTRGATITSFALIEHKDGKGQPVGIVHASPDALPPLSIVLNDSRADLPARVVYEADRESVSLKSGSQTLVMSFADPSGLQVRKAFTFHADSYGIDLAVSVNGAPSYQLAMGGGFGIHSIADADAVHVGPSLLAGTERKSFVLKDLKEGEVEISQNLRWIAQEDKYFAAALKPVAGVSSARVWKSREHLEISCKSSSAESRYRLYAGPKQYEILKKEDLQDIVDFGFWSFIAHPLFWFLKALNGAVGNYGVAIILISVITRVPFIPLMNKSQSSMKKMQELNPKMQELREKFKKDPQRMQAETMKLYKDAGVNPMSGCLPMLLQIPVFFALYKVLLVSIELRHAPFAGWITDLSAPDTLFGHFPDAIPLLGGAALGILPFLMGITMFIQQTLTPNTSADPAQAKMMKYLPVVFTFMFFNLSSGLVLYWTIGNVMGILQQLYTNSKTSSPAAAA